MKNPLRKRLFRELKGEAGKYFVIFFLLMSIIGFVSGFLVADGSMLTAYNESFEKYNIEDGNFTVKEKVNRAQQKEIAKSDVTLYENFYVEPVLTNGSTMRIFKNREEVNRVCLMKGEFPKSADEIAIDRMYADNNELSVGDIITEEESKREWKITGLVALSDYSCLFSDNNDSMFDAVKFGVGIVTEEAFDTFNTDNMTCNYSWKYGTEPKGETKEKNVSEDFMKALNNEVSLETFVPRYSNQAIQFTGEDMGSDRMMMIILLYIVIAILAFVFGITISNTIHKEATVIGTLRASGYTRRELILHYMTAPMLVTFAGAVVGNILGYTVLKNVCAGMYYGSYSLPTYVTLWNGEAFVMTTIVPVFLMAVINFFLLKRTLSLSPLTFLRRDLKRRKQKHTLPLSARLPFFSRFRLRVIFQNVSNYVVLTVGILFANLLLMFGLMLPQVLKHYQTEIEKNLLCNYQYILNIPLNAMNEEHKLESLMNLMYFEYQVQTDNEDAEKFSVYSLKTLDSEYKTDEIMLYGVKADSCYISLEGIDGDEVLISKAYSDKYKVKKGDVITLRESYEDTEYEFTVGGIYDYEGSLCVFMPIEQLNRTFDLGNNYFSGYLSDSEITDIDEKYISSVIDLESLTKISRQLTVSMGSMMYMVDGFAIVIFMVVIYLLSKIVIEKNAQSISMAKILGYSNAEIARLYIIPTSIVTALLLIITLPLEKSLMEIIFYQMMMTSMSGWIPFYVSPILFPEMFAIGILTYAVVAVIEYRKVRKIPMEEALKNVE